MSGSQGIKYSQGGYGHERFHWGVACPGSVAGEGSVHTLGSFLKGDNRVDDGQGEVLVGVETLSVDSGSRETLNPTSRTRRRNLPLFIEPRAKGSTPKLS